MTTADGTAIPKGTRLVGHLTQVQAHSKDSPDSVMAIVFDRAELKGGASLAIYSEIRSLTPPVLGRRRAATKILAAIHWVAAEP